MIRNCENNQFLLHSQQPFFVENKNLESLRDEIDRIDSKIVDLLNQRVRAAVRRVARRVELRTTAVAVVELLDVNAPVLVRAPRHRRARLAAVVRRRPRLGIVGGGVHRGLFCADVPGDGRRRQRSAVFFFTLVRDRLVP